MTDTKTDTEQRIFRIPSFRWSDTVKRFERLNRKADQLGVDRISWDEVGTEDVLVMVLQSLERQMWFAENGSEPRDREVDPSDTAAIARAEEMGWVVSGRRTYQLVTVTGTAPKLAGWTFRGTLVHVDDVGNMLKTIGEGQVPERYRSADPWCEHCELNRYRRDTFLVESDEGEWKQVGRQCLADFLGHQNPEAIARWAEVLANLSADLEGDEGDWGNNSAETVMSTSGFLGVVAAVIERDGWRSRSKDPENATADKALDAYFERVSTRNGTSFTVTDEHKAQADEALTWARDLDEGELADNDFLWNLHVVTAGDWVSVRGAGILAAVFVAKKFRDKKEREKDERPESNWFGEVKKRSTYELTVTFTLVTEGYYGSTQLVKFLDADGNEAVWFNGSNDWEWELDETYTVKATVKEHSTYEDRKQTVLTRVAKQKEKS